MIPNDLIEGLIRKRILVTGASGLVGSTLVDLLMNIDQACHTRTEIWVLGRNRAKLQKRFTHCPENAIHILEGDVSSCGLADGNFDHIIHAASPAHPLAYSQTPVDVMKANLLGTINMLELAKRSGGRLLFLSSGEIYGVSEDAQSAFQENDYGYTDILDPRSCYPESKRAAETLCASYFAQFGVDTVVARLCHVYGSAITDSNSRADAQFLRKAVRHEDIIMKSPGLQVRSFCYVKDAAIGLLYVLLKGKSGEAYNVANRNSVATIREYAETLASISGVRLKNEFPSEEEKRGYTRIARAVMDASKLEKLGWQPKFDLKSGLTDMLLDYRNL